MEQPRLLKVNGKSDNVMLSEMAEGIGSQEPVLFLYQWCFSYTNFEGGQHMVILIIADGLIIFIYVDAFMEPEMETEVCGWPLQ